MTTAGVLPEPREQLGVRPCHPGRNVLQTRPVGILADGQQEFADCGLGP